MNKGHIQWQALEHHTQQTAASAILVFAAMLYEWGVPLSKVMQGMPEAYKLAAKKQKQRDAASPRKIEEK